MNLPYNKLFLLTVLTVWPTSGRAQPLEEVLRMVYSTNPDIQAERARQEATEQSPDEARAGLLPQVSAQGNIGASRNRQVVNPDLFGQVASQERRLDYNPALAAVTAEQILFSGFRNLNAIKQARARVKAGGAKLRAVEQEVLLRAATSYFDVILNLQIYDANKTNVEVHMEQSKQAEARFRYGDITDTDVNQTKARLAMARSGLSAAQARLAESSADYRRIVGEAPATLDENLPLPPLPETEEIAQELARELAPAIELAKQDEETSRRQIYIEDAEFFPTISLNAQYEYSDEPSSLIDRNEGISYGIRMTVPIFSGGKRSSSSRAARALNRRDKARIIASEREVAASISMAWNDLIAAHMRIGAAQSQIDANVSAVAGVRREAELGARTNLDLLNAEQELLNARIALVSSKRDEYIAAYRLLAAMGAPLMSEAGEAREGSAGGEAAETAAAETHDAVRVSAPASAQASSGTPSEVDKQERAGVIDSVSAPQSLAMSKSGEPVAEVNDHFVQLGSFSSEAAARGRILAATGPNEVKVSELANEFGVAVRTVDLESGLYYQSLVGPMPYSDAAMACKSVSGDCIVIHK